MTGNGANPTPTIAAVSTAYGEGGIGIVRISGNKAGAILKQLYRRPATPESADFQGFSDRFMHYGHIADPESGETIDEALIVLMRGPHTYTGEDVAEIHCHGSVVSLRRTLEAALRCGAEPASPGEFTQRAFLNGRIDLTKAEAVADIVRAKTDASAQAAITQLSGGLSAQISAIRDTLADALALAAVHIDYPDDDKDFNDPDSAQTEIASRLRATSTLIEGLVASAATGRILREGLNIVLAGASNTGKSSLLNTLLGDTRVIVTDIPGTTRDSIEERADIRGLTVKLTDTAGIRETEDEIERLGIDRAKEAVTAADLTIFLIDGSKAPDKTDETAINSVKQALTPTANTPTAQQSAHNTPATATPHNPTALNSNPPTAQQSTQTTPTAPISNIPTVPQPPQTRIIPVISKSDLPRAATDNDIAKLLRGAPATAPIPLSAKTGQGIEDLKDAIEEAVYSGKSPQADEYLVTNVRHRDLLIKASKAIAAGEAILAQNGDLDLAEIDIRSAYDHLGEITGETTTDDILTKIFAKFCIGK
jgi:tRNA modification GTPase